MSDASVKYVLNITFEVEGFFLNLTFNYLGLFADFDQLMKEKKVREKEKMLHSYHFQMNKLLW